jgi:tripartite-type tricarboxylate transporter receptor subunit TctC
LDNIHRSLTEEKIEHRKYMSRRSVLLSGLTLAAMSYLPFRAHAASEWPSRGPIKIVVPFSPGASTDTLARFVAKELSQRLNQSIIVENKAGAGGVIGTTFVANQPPDGYTLLFQANPYVATPLLLAEKTKKLPYDPVKDLQPVDRIATAPLMMIVSNDLNVKSLHEFIELARTKPSSISYGSAGVGSINHMAVEMLASMANIKLVHVPYTGIGPATTDLLGGRLQMMTVSLPSALPYVRAGKVHALAVTSSSRSSLVPELPTVSEAGIPGYHLEAWWGLLGPLGLPAPIIKRLDDELASLLRSKSMAEVLEREGANAKPLGSTGYAALIAAEVPQWNKVIQEAHITVN